MNKIITTLAIAGLGAGVAVGAQAQTIEGGTGTSFYSLSAILQTPTPTVGADYVYNYTITLNSVGAGEQITALSFAGIEGYVANSASIAPGLNPNPPFTSPDFTITPGDVSTISGLTTIDATAVSVPFANVGDNEILTFDSTDPVGSTPLSLSTNAQIPGSGGGKLGGTGATAQGPTAVTTAVPEAGSFALLGLGLLPLGLVARRRMSRNA